MNEQLFTTSDGLRLIQQFEGAPRLKARLCEGNSWELGWGCTFRPDGSRIQEGETCTEEEAMTLFRHALGVFEQGVRDHVTIELEPHQFSALVCFAYNVGVANFASSTVLKETNARRFEDAAAAFGMWVFATKNGWKQAYRGLLRRRYSEAALYMGYSWERATEDDAIALQRIIPEGDPPKGTDRVTYKTPFLEVLRVAQNYPLPAQPPEASELLLDKPAPSATPVGSGAGPSPPPNPATVPVPQSNTGSSKPASPGQKSVPSTTSPGPQGSVPASPLPPKPQEPTASIGQQSGAVDATRKSDDWSKSAKSMIFSRRAWGLGLVVFGRLWMLKTGSNAVLNTVSDPLVMEMFSGLAVMCLGEILQWYGEKKAKRPLC